MAMLTFETAMAYAGHRYQVQLSHDTRIGQIAGYLTEHEAYIRTKTLEIAYPLEPEQRLSDVDVQPGDRLVIFTQAIRQSELPAPLRAGDKVIRMASGDFEMKAYGKQGVLIGRPDDTRQITPDIDLRYFIAPDKISFISRKCMRLDYDPQSRTWYVSRLGQTRLMFNEFELTEERIPLDAHQVIRFYRASDDPHEPGSERLGEVTLTIEAAQVQAGQSHFTVGDYDTPVCIGSEHNQHVVKASQAIQIEQITKQVLHYHQRAWTSATRAYLMRLLSPNSVLSDLPMKAGVFLYTGGNLNYGQNFLLLHDIHNRERVYTLSAGGEDEEKWVGCRIQGKSDPTLDVDLYDALIIRGHDPSILKKISTRQGQIVYRAHENTWWLRAEERAKSPMFINNTRINSSYPTQLLSGDVLTLGPSITHYYARLEIEITTKASF